MYLGGQCNQEAGSPLSALICPCMQQAKTRIFMGWADQGMLCTWRGMLHRLLSHAVQWSGMPCITCHAPLPWHDDLAFLSKAVYQAMSQLGVSTEQELPEMLDNLRRVNSMRHVQLKNGSCSKCSQFYLSDQP